MLSLVRWKRVFGIFQFYQSLLSRRTTFSFYYFFLCVASSPVRKFKGLEGDSTAQRVCCCKDLLNWGTYFRALRIANYHLSGRNRWILEGGRRSHGIQTVGIW